MPTLPSPSAEIVYGYQTGLIGRITEMHARYYAEASGFGRTFESGVAGSLAEFCGRLDSGRNAVWCLVRDRAIVGSIAIDGEDLGPGLAHIRWFIIDPTLRGAGQGGKLLDAALSFADHQGFPETHLWTFAGLDTARHLYETRGFALAEERRGTQWGSEVLEQRFVRFRIAN